MNVTRLVMEGKVIVIERSSQACWVQTKQTISRQHPVGWQDTRLVFIFICHSWFFFIQCFHFFKRSSCLPVKLSCWCIEIRTSLTKSDILWASDSCVLYCPSSSLMFVMLIVLVCFPVLLECLLCLFARICSSQGPSLPILWWLCMYSTYPDRHCRSGLSRSLSDLRQPLRSKYSDGDPGWGAWTVTVESVERGWLCAFFLFCRALQGCNSQSCGGHDCAFSGKWRLESVTVVAVENRAVQN